MGNSERTLGSPRYAGRDRRLRGTVDRACGAAGRLDRRRGAPSKKGAGFVQPDGPHKHWHLDISYVNLGGTFYFLITVLDGSSRYIVYTEIRETMKEFDTEVVVQRALEKYPGEHPRIIADNGPQFLAREFKEFIRLMARQQVRSPMAWAEDRATQRCDLSADPGAKTGAGARRFLALLPFHPLRDWHESDKPSRQDAATIVVGCLPTH